MKSLLVDALRQANDSGVDADGKTPAVEPDVQPDTADQDAEPRALDAEALELLETQSFVASQEAAVPAAAEPEDAVEMPVVASRAAADDHNKESRPASYERLAIWTPVACLILGTSAAAFQSVWSTLTAEGQRTGFNRMMDLSAEVETRAAEVPDAHTRFALQHYSRPIEPVKIAPPRSAAQVVSEAPLPRPLPRLVQAKAPERPTSLGAPTFSSLEAAYRASLHGDLSHGGFKQILTERIEADARAARDDIQVLLQRFPQAAPLHLALGDSYAAAARWPEARLAYQQANSIDSDNPGYMLKLAMSLEALGRRDEAERLYDTVTELRPGEDR